MLVVRRSQGRRSCLSIHRLRARVTQLLMTIKSFICRAMMDAHPFYLEHLIFISCVVCIRKESEQPRLKNMIVRSCLILKTSANGT
jgi:hypothetical protein